MPFSITKTSSSIQITDEAFQFRLYYQNNSLFYSLHQDPYYLDEATSALLILNSKKKVQPLIPQILSEGDFLVNTSSFTDDFGTGIQLEFVCSFSTLKVSSHKVSAQWIGKIYPCNRQGIGPFLTIQLKLHDWPEELKDAPLLGYAPLFMQNTGSINLQQPPAKSTPENITFYSNGWQSWSLNKLLKSKDRWQSSPLEFLRIMDENQDQRLIGQFQSEWHTVVSDVSTNAAIVMGFITLKDQFCRILMDPLATSGKVKWLCAYSQTDGITLQHLNPGLTQSEELLITITPPDWAYEALIEMSRIGGIKARALVPQSPIVGWCSWYYYYNKITQKEMVANTEFFKHRKDLPIQLIQLDDGYETEISDWGIDPPYIVNQKFPQGLKWLVQQIHENGFKAGLWTAPFFTNDKAKLYQSHPNWIIKDVNNRPIRTGYLFKNWQFGLDLSQDEVISHVERLAQTISKEWKFDFLKIDFIFSAEPVRGKFQNPNYSRAQLLRRGVEAVRRGMTPQQFILGCGAPLGPCVGLVDAMRIGPDTAAVWSPLEILTKIGKFYFPSLQNALKSTISRSYMHNTYWTNDPDCVVVRRNQTKLTLEEILLQLTIFGLSSGQLLISDDMPLVDADRIDLLKRLLPPHSQAARPLDLFQNNMPELYANTAYIANRLHHLICIINWAKKSTNKQYLIRDLLIIADRNRYPEDQQFLIIDYWKEIPLGIFTLNQKIAFSRISSHGCMYLGIVPLEKDDPTPILAFSTFHIYQGAEEIVKFQASSTHLEISLKLLGKRQGKLYFYFPETQSVSHSTDPVQSFKNNDVVLLCMPLNFEDNYKATLDLSS